MKSGVGLSKSSSSSSFNNRLRNTKNHAHTLRHTTSIVPPPTQQKKQQRHNSLPVGASSPIVRGGDPSALSSSHPDATDFTMPALDEEGVFQQRPFRPRSAALSSSSSTSGLPAVSLKGHQHPYISKKRASLRKNPRNNSTAGTISPDLITTSCDEIMQLARNDYSLVSTNTPIESRDNGTISIDSSNTSIIDCAEDCLDGVPSSTSGFNATSTSNSENNESEAGYHGTSQSGSQQGIENDISPLERTFSDALIIPDPFEREPDDLLSPGTNIHDVNNLIV